MAIREAELEDILEILHVINESNAEAFKKIIPPKYFKKPVLTLDKFLDIFNKMKFYICEWEGKIIGVAALEVVSSDLGRIRFVYVLPKYQRKGVGSSLISHIEDEAKKLGIKKLIVPYVHEKAIWAIKFYQKLGYKVFDRKPRPWGYDLYFEKEI